MCNIIPPDTRVLTIEVFTSGKVSIPGVIPPPDQLITIDELRKCRDLIDLMINNPNNFHVVGEPVKAPKINFKDRVSPFKNNNEFMQAQPVYHTPVCKECKKDLRLLSDAEIENLLCFDCKQRQIFDKANVPVGNYVEQLKEVAAAPCVCCYDGCNNEVLCTEVYCNDHFPVEGKTCEFAHCFNEAVTGKNYCKKHSKHDN